MSDGLQKITDIVLGHKRDRVAFCAGQFAADMQAVLQAFKPTCAEDVSNLIAEAAPVYGLCGEQIGTKMVGPINRHYIVVAGQHDDRQMLQPFVRSDLMEK